MLLAHPRLMPLNLVLNDVARGVSLLTRKTLIAVGFLSVLLTGAAILDAETRAQVGKAWTENLRPLVLRVAGIPAVQAEEPSMAEADDAQPLDARDQAAAQPAPTQEVGRLDKREHLNLAKYLARRYRVSTSATDMLVDTAFATGKEVGVDPVLILAVMAIESGLNPFAESGVGAQGLMQVMSRIHQDKFEDFGGLQAAFNPIANIKVGAQVLKDCIRRGGSLEAGLRLYVGAGNGADDGGYGAKVLAERARLSKAMMGRFDFSPPRPPVAPPAQPAVRDPMAVSPKTVDAPATEAKDHLAV